MNLIDIGAILLVAALLFVVMAGVRLIDKIIDDINNSDLS